MKYTLIKDLPVTEQHPITYETVTLFRIKALKSFTNTNPLTEESYTVKEGDLGGLVAGYHNLDQEGNCWVTYNSKMFDNAKRIDNSIGFGSSKACENSQQSGYSRQMGNSIQSGNSQQREFSVQMDYSHQSGNSIQRGQSTQMNRSKQTGESVQGGSSKQAGFSLQAGNSKQIGKSTQTGHTQQSGYSVQQGHSIQCDFSKQGDKSIQQGNSKQQGHSKQGGESLQGGNSRQYSYSYQGGTFKHTGGTHNTLSNEGELTDDTLGFLEFPPTGNLSLGMNLNTETGIIVLTTSYEYRADTKGYLKFETFIRKASADYPVDIEKYLAMFRLLLTYKEELKTKQ